MQLLCPQALYLLLFFEALTVQKQALELHCILSCPNDDIGYSLVAIEVARVLWSWLSLACLVNLLQFINRILPR